MSSKLKLGKLINQPIILKSLDGIHYRRVLPSARHFDPHSDFIFLTDESRKIRITSGGLADKVRLKEYKHQPRLEYIIPQKPTFIEYK